MSNQCAAVHRWADASRRYQFPFDTSEIPCNGVYILFEKGEHGHGRDRIVRIGSHMGDGRLGSRLEEHFVNENKDRSIFRKNIGRAILNQTGDSFLECWNKTLITKADRNTHISLVDNEYQKNIEMQVSRYLRCNFSFCVVGTADEGENPLALEKKLIATVSLCNECQPSENWLGRHSPKEKIASSGLWQEQHLYKKENIVSAWDIDLYFSNNSISSRNN